MYGYDKFFIAARLIGVLVAALAMLLLVTDASTVPRANGLLDHPEPAPAECAARPCVSGSAVRRSLPAAAPA